MLCVAFPKPKKALQTYINNKTGHIRGQKTKDVSGLNI